MNGSAIEKNAVWIFEYFFFFERRKSEMRRYCVGIVRENEMSTHTHNLPTARRSSFENFSIAWAPLGRTIFTWTQIAMAECVCVFVCVTVNYEMHLNWCIHKFRDETRTLHPFDGGQTFYRRCRVWRFRLRLSFILECLQPHDNKSIK